ncbi:helix-turn-helix domain-containing protein [Mycolicibacterium sp. XJ1904]
MARTNDALGDFFRSRRSQIQPADVGLPRSNRRRVLGLRREEVAMLAGISTDYYHRIEQGRERPSDQVLDALANALRLSPDATAYMRNLASGRGGRTRLAKPNRPLNPDLQHLLDSWPMSPASIHDGTATVQLANDLAGALSPSFARGGNPVRSLFLDPASREFYRDWDGLTAWAVRWLRSFVGDHPDPGLDALVEELNTTSPRFRDLWASHHVKGHASGLLLLNHPEIGHVDLHFQHMMLRGSASIMVVYWAAPGSPSEHALRRLIGQS